MITVCQAVRIAYYAHPVWQKHLLRGRFVRHRLVFCMTCIDEEHAHRVAARARLAHQMLSPGRRVHVAVLGIAAVVGVALDKPQVATGIEPDGALRSHGDEAALSALRERVEG